jgi:hypothetical protein
MLSSLDNFEVDAGGLDGLLEVSFVTSLWIDEAQIRDGEIQEVYASLSRVPTEAELESIHLSLGVKLEWITIPQSGGGCSQWLRVQLRKNS